ncbi:uncharacterized protein LOC119670447 isoform X2 [Teleopsis dalmanni]|uniref:uncharacterized protein LOC119668996 isoform X2 n=1 Tax=Teleopsis dalmanni TaxID=139649 RepID=UPI0018CD4A5C|nr:uncharacterized protein LOC119668996 isoform X2 [Teleopsis dalmanni]XP_037934800.1 uncharacterized protein LOC119669095 isoform X2 [Teleopsis dalmanni]XP_037936636.1 uncharacterized protein LOC119670447 isoform X2 [Teleopsis dalmanni]
MVLTMLNPAPQNCRDVAKNENLEKELQVDKVGPKPVEILDGAFNEATDDAEYTNMKFKMKSISHWPYHCPIASCRQVLGVNCILSHCLVDHTSDLWMKGVQCKEIYNKQRTIIEIDVGKIEFNKSICLGCIMYAGLAENDRKTLPGIRGLCAQNAFLPPMYMQYKNHMPILIMCCSTSWKEWISRRELRNKFENSNHKGKELLVFWLTGPETAKPVHLIMTVYSKNLLYSKSVILSVKPLREPQHPKAFFVKEANYLMLTAGEIEKVTEQYSARLNLDFIIKEF